MSGLASVVTDLGHRQEQAAREFIEQRGYREIQNVVLVPDETEPLRDRGSVHVQMPTLRFSHNGGAGVGRRLAEISAVGLEIPTR